jgi:GTP-binding protein Era
VHWKTLTWPFCWWDINDNWEEVDQLFGALRLKVPALVVVNKLDQTTPDRFTACGHFFSSKPYCREVVGISALLKSQIDHLLQIILGYLPEGEPFYEADELSDLPTKFFVSEIIREKIFSLFEEEIPYHTTVIVTEFKQKSSLIKIRAEVIVQRESQKAIIIGEGGKMIKIIGSDARKEIEKFLDQKIFLELFVKVRPKWRENDHFLKEYGY